MNLAPLPKRLFCIDNHKASKARDYGYLNAILYLAPHSYAGVGNLCPHASPACIAACLGLHSGQVSMVASEAPSDANATRLSRANKARHFMLNRAAFMRGVLFDIARNARKANDAGLKLAVRLNGSSDIAFEGVPIVVTESDALNVLRLSRGLIAVASGRHANLFAAMPMVQFLDYTKNPRRMTRVLPVNYHLTFSRSETNETQARDVLQSGGNVAVVFDRTPKRWNAARVIDGDSHDLRFLDPRGVVVGLSPKGPKAKRDVSGFVVRLAA